MILTIDHEAIMQRAQELPPLPQSAARLTGILASSEPDFREIIQVIECDPVLTMKLLRVANSAVGGTRHRVTTLRNALVRLGTGTIVGLAIGMGIRPFLGKRIPGYDLSESDFWTHSLTSAFAAESIQARSKNWSGQHAFTAALLHDIGKLVLGPFLNEALSAWLERAAAEGKLLPFAAEKEILSLHHGEAGGIIAQHWGLPECLVHGITYHHEPAACADEIGCVTYLANLVSHQLEIEQTGAEFTLSESSADEIGAALTRLGLAKNELDHACADARNGMHAASRPTG